MHTSRKKQAIGMAMAIGLSASAFLAQNALAESAYTCIHDANNKSIVYTYKGKSMPASYSEFAGRLGKLVLYECSDNNTFLLFEKGLVRTGGGKRVFETGEFSMPFPGDPTKVITGSTLDIDEGRAVKGKIQWGTVAVVVLDTKSILVIKRIHERKASQLQTPAFPGIDPENCNISIEGSLERTKITITSPGFSKELVISGTASDDMVWE
ncbi:MAG: hypothetical protein N3G76_02180 [Candidatus Micrarchaeota archaeon]|nr:hypothetical protein [Candidatus Micrarchaeota archaeon]